MLLLSHYTHLNVFVKTKSDQKNPLRWGNVLTFAFQAAKIVKKKKKKEHKWPAQSSDGQRFQDDKRTTKCHSDSLVRRRKKTKKEADNAQTMTPGPL